MNTLIVTAHPESTSLSNDIARQLAQTLDAGSKQLANLATEGFDPRFSNADRVTYKGEGEMPSDVAAEQKRLDWADHVVLVFPVYWWSMPALLKGWIDRVFVNGWAFDVDGEKGIRRNLERLTMHLVPVAGDDADVYERHGYASALRTQIEHGIIDFCGMRHGVTTFVHSSEQGETPHRAAAVSRAVDEVSRAITN